MARSHGRIHTTIWTDPDFTALDPGPQRLFFFLLSQSDLNQAGLLPLRLRRWCRSYRGATTDQLRADLTALGAARFVLVDEDTEEVLVRTFVRNDGVWRQPKVMQRMGEDARQIASVPLRAALLTELSRLPLQDLSDEPPPRAGGASARAVVVGVIDALAEEFGYVLETPPDTPSDTPPDSPPDTPGEGHREPSYARSPIPLPPTPVPPSAAGPGTPAPAPAPPAQVALIDDERPPAPRSTNHRAQALAATYRELVPLSKFPAVMRIAKQALDAGYPDDQVEAALRRLAAEGRPVTVDTLRVELDGLPTARSPAAGGSTTDQRVAAGAALIDRFAREEGHR